MDKDEWDNLHHFSPTSAADQDPTTLGRELDDDGAWSNALTDETDSVHVMGSEILKMHCKSPFHALTVFRSDATVEKQIVHVVVSSSINHRLGLTDGASSSKLRLAPIDGESLRQFVHSKEISPLESSPTDNIVDLYRSSPSSPPPKTVIGCPILDPADLIGWLFLMDQDNGERLSLPSSTPKPIIVRPSKDPTDLIGWLFLKDKGNGQRLRDDVGCECPEPAIVSPTSDPPDLIGWLFLTDQDNGERSALLASPKPATLHLSLDPSDPIGLIFLKDQDDGGVIVPRCCPTLGTIVLSLIRATLLFGHSEPIRITGSDRHCRQLSNSFSFGRSRKMGSEHHCRQQPNPLLFVRPLIRPTSLVG
jgi:hypothetical protein